MKTSKLLLVLSFCSLMVNAQERLDNYVDNFSYKMTVQMLSIYVTTTNRPADWVGPNQKSYYYETNKLMPGIVITFNLLNYDEQEFVNTNQAIHTVYCNVFSSDDLENWTFVKEDKIAVDYYPKWNRGQVGWIAFKRYQFTTFELNTNLQNVNHRFYRVVLSGAS
jgi:hypothetical protein